MNLRKTVLFLFVFFTISITSYSNPENSIKVREILIGGNDSIYVTLSVKRTNYFDEFNYVDSTFINQIGIKSNKLIIKEYISYSNFIMTPVGYWGVAKDTNSISFDIGKLLYDNNINFAFPSNIYIKDSLTINNSGLVLMTKKFENSLIMSSSFLKKKLSINDLKNIELLQVFEINRYAFFQFQVGVFKDNKVVIIPIEKPLLTNEIVHKE